MKLTLQEIADLATRLSADIGERVKLLDEYKDRLRAHAEKMAHGSGERQEIPTSFAGPVTVTFASPTLTLKKGAHPELCKADIGQEAWNTLFAEKIVLAPEAREALGLLPRATQKRVEALLEDRPNTPRVAFPVIDGRGAR